MRFLEIRRNLDFKNSFQRYCDVARRDGSRCLAYCEAILMPGCRNSSDLSELLYFLTDPIKSSILEVDYVYPEII